MTDKNKTVLITGATDGIGRQSALDLARLGWKVIIHGRTEKKCINTIDAIKKEIDNANVEYIIADLASLDDIKKMADEIKNRFLHINALLNNAGVFMHNRQLSQNGIEITFAVNHLAHFFLTGLLLDLLKKAENSKIVTVSSMTHASSIDFNNLQGERSYSGYSAYALSKLANILFTFFLSDRVTKYNITANCLHPGVINTKLLKAGWGSIGTSVKEGAKTSVFLVDSKQSEKITGSYFSDMRPVRSAEISYNKEIQQRLWNISEELTGFKYNF
jgi:NAD(P)-dependent dehydrogenase (short-subunit alcohol dehydrogenase family)